jgi:hypothetical protein
MTLPEECANNKSGGKTCETLRRLLSPTNSAIILAPIKPKTMAMEGWRYRRSFMTPETRVYSDRRPDVERSVMPVVGQQANEENTHSRKCELLRRFVIHAAELRAVAQ